MKKILSLINILTKDHTMSTETPIYHVPNSLLLVNKYLYPTYQTPSMVNTVRELIVPIPTSLLVVGQYPTDEERKKAIEGLIKNDVERCLDKNILISISNQECIPDEFIHYVKNLNDNQVSFYVIQEIETYLTRIVNNILKHIGNIQLSIDNFLDDWPDLKQWLISNELSGLVIKEINMLMYNVLQGLTNIQPQLFIDKSKENNNDVYRAVVVSSVYDHVVYLNSVTLTLYKDPGIYVIRNTDRQYKELGSILDHVGVTRFKLITNNIHREDQSWTIYYNKVNDSFTIYV